MSCGPIARLRGTGRRLRGTGIAARLLGAPRRPRLPGPGRRLPRRAAVLVLLVAGALACERRVAPPTAPAASPPPPPRIEAVSPPARGIGVHADTPIWVQFAVPLVATSASERNVFLKLDTRRLAIRLAWDPGSRRLHILPQEPLALRSTHTVELGPGLQFADGGALGESHLWQFTTNSLRRPHSPLPMDGQSWQSPFVALRWGGLTESAAGTILYEVHAAHDSAPPADPAHAALATGPGGLFVPRARWRQDGPNYWSVHALNLATGERLVGPVWRFESLPAGAAFDSFPAAVLDWNWIEQSNPGRQRCYEDSLVMGPPMICTIRWKLGPPDSTVRLAGAAIELTPRYATVPAVTGPSVWSATIDFAGCGLSFPLPTDAVNGWLADAVVSSPDRIRFSSDALTAHVEAASRLGAVHGYQFRAPLRRAYYGPGAGSPVVRAVLWLHRYRAAPPAPPAFAVGSPGR